jgi:hypothetical protein
MTDEIVTSEKPKNPGRQEWGRKLGRMSKELKLKKLPQLSPVIEQAPEPRFKMEYAFGIAGVVAIIALYYQKKSYDSCAKVNVVVAETKPMFNNF